MNEEEEKRDLEEELKEEKDRYERQNQEIYDEVTKGNEELRRRQEADYEKNRRKLKKNRDESLDPDRFKSQLETIKKGVETVTPDLSSPKEMSEFFTDLVIDTGIIGRSLGEDLPTGIATVFARRMAKNTNLQNSIQDSIGKVAKTIDTTTAPDEPVSGFNLIKQIQAVFSGEMFGVTGGTLPIKNIRQNQLMFGWESASNAANIPQVKPGGLFQIQPRLVRRNRNQVQRKGFLFQKPISLDITGGFKTSRRHRDFEEFIQDLLEADRIPAKNIDIAGFRSSAVRQAKYGTELDLYQDYLQGYFNTYDTLDGAMALTINNKPIKLGQSAMGAKSIENLTEINKLFRAYKLNPKAFDSGAFAPGSKTDVRLLKEFADSKSLDDFLLKNTKLQRHHLNIIDDSFALVKGLTGNDLTRMRKAMNEIGLIAGNDPANLARVPQQLHQNFVHTQVWGAYGPAWTGRSAKAKQLRNQISSLPFEERLPYLEQLKEAEQLTRSIINNAVDEFIDTQIAGFKISLADKEDFQNFMAKLVQRDLSQTKLIDINQPTTIRSTDKSGRRTRRQADLEDIGAERMQDDL